MNMIALIAPSPQNNGEKSLLGKFGAELSPLPDGVVQPAENIWLIDPEIAIDFVLKAGQIAERVTQRIQVYSNVSKRLVE